MKEVAEQYLRSQRALAKDSTSKYNIIIIRINNKYFSELVCHVKGKAKVRKRASHFFIIIICISLKAPFHYNIHDSESLCHIT